MRNERKWEQRHVKYIIKNPKLFYAFLLIGIVIFLILSMSIRMEDGTSLLQQLFVDMGRGL